jgi:hypothetical protein
MVGASTMADVFFILEEATIDRAIPQQQRLALTQLVPAAIAKRMRSPEGLTELVAGLQRFDLRCGFASRWRQSYPWPDKPWQMVFATAARTAHSMANLVPEEQRPRLHLAIKAMASDGVVPPQVDDDVGRLLVRVVRTAWQTHRGLGTSKPELVIEQIVSMVTPAEPQPQARLREVAKGMRSIARASPVVAGPRLLNNPDPVVRSASYEALTFLVGRCHHDNPPEAQGWLEALLAP